jgi:saccharopine dehydrogenase-like NADP-dependent oxidoreductase
MMLDKAIKEKGVVPPEKIGMNEKLFKSFHNGLASHGIRIEEEITEGWRYK